MNSKLTFHLLHSILTFTLSVKISNAAGKKKIRKRKRKLITYKIMLVYFLTEQSNKICVLLNIYIKYKE